MRRVVLTGNGLSVALNKDFSLEGITKRFFDRLTEDHKTFIEHHMQNKYDQRDFEEAIASIELAYEMLKHYSDFLNLEKGKRFMSSYNLHNGNFEEHIEAVQNIIYEYTAAILDLIDGNVKKEAISEKLDGFVQWLLRTIDESSEIDLFTLNFDLLLETILLTYYSKQDFADFHYRGGKWNPINNEYRYYFGPDRSKQIHPENYSRGVRLHHLHGSLSSFKDLSDGRLFKITTENLRNNEVYKKIFDLKVIPSIVTGGGKSLKIQQEPFSYYYNEFKKKMVIENSLCDELYIVGYSFRDNHINNAIKERLKISRRREDSIPLKLVIVDYAINEEDKQQFIDVVNKALGIPKKNSFTIDDDIFCFEGANSIK